MSLQGFGRRCATHDPSAADRVRMANLENEFVETTRLADVELSATIHVAFIHIVDGGAGSVSTDQRTRQIEVLNEDYANIGLKFTYDESEVVVVDNANFFSMGHGSLRERDCKRQNQVLSPVRGLNFYTASPGGGLLGWATFPFEMEGDPDMDGVVMLHSTLPGGGAAPFDLGRTAVHEVGHWLGLYHTFQDGCAPDSPGDEVGDTPRHAGPNFGKPTAADQPHNLCSGHPTGLLCPINNYMNYVDDDTMSEFTAGQKKRIWAQINMFRAGLLPPPTEALRSEVARPTIVW